MSCGNKELKSRDAIAKQSESFIEYTPGEKQARVRVDRGLDPIGGSIYVYVTFWLGGASLIDKVWLLE